MKRGDRRADLLAQNPLERHPPREDRGDPDSELREGSRHLAADETHAHDHRVSIRHGLALYRVTLSSKRCRSVAPGEAGPDDHDRLIPLPRRHRSALSLA